MTIYNYQQSAQDDHVVGNKFLENNEVDNFWVEKENNDLVLESESKTKLVGVLVQTGGVNGTTNGQLDTRAEQLSVSIRRMKH